MSGAEYSTQPYSPSPRKFANALPMATSSANRHFFSSSASMKRIARAKFPSQSGSTRICGFWERKCFMWLRFLRSFGPERAICLSTS